jgi:hypothetical protein
VSLAQNSPNPFRPATTIRFELPQRTAVELNVYTVRGRRVTTLVSRVLPAGSHAAVWNGRDDNGHPVAAGAYFYHLSADGVSLTKKMLLLR